MKPRTVSAKEARANLSELLGSVHYTKQPVVVEKNGKPFAVLVHPDWYELLQKQFDEAWQRLDALMERNSNNDPDEVERIVAEVIGEVRQERHEREQAAKRGT